MFFQSVRSEEHTSELQSRFELVCRLLLEKKKNRYTDFAVRKKKMKKYDNAHIRIRHNAGPLLNPLTPTSRTYDVSFRFLFCFFFNDTATTEIYTLSLHDALPIWCRTAGPSAGTGSTEMVAAPPPASDRKSTRLNSSHVSISYAVLCLKKKIALTAGLGVAVDVGGDWLAQMPLYW